MVKNRQSENICRLCDSDKLSLAIEIPPSPIGDNYSAAYEQSATEKSYSLDVYLCQKCGQLQLLDTVDPKLIYDNYSYQTGISLGLNEHFVKYSETLLSYFDKNEGTFVVDIGCNDGSLLRAFATKGSSVLGIEPAKKIANKVEQSGLNVINDYFSLDLTGKIVDQYGQADIITANNVMANIDNLNEFIQGIKTVLAPNGIFSFESGYLIDLISHGVLDNIYHEHLCYFRLNPLARFFERYDLELFDVSHSDSKGGSIQGLVQHKNGPRTIRKSVFERQLWEKGLLYDEINIYKQFSKQMEATKFQLQNLLRELKNNGKKISGYGASVGVTTLLYYYQLDADTIDTLFDDNPGKHGLYSPGKSIPVLSSEQIYSDSPDYILLLPWRYAHNIINKHASFLASGGHFIIPLPSVTII